MKIVIIFQFLSSFYIMPVQSLYSNNLVKIVDGKKFAEEQYVIIGDKGVKIKYYSVEKDKVEKITIIGKDGKYKMKETKSGNIVESDIDNKGLSSALKMDKLKFAKEYIKDIIKKEGGSGGSGGSRGLGGGSSSKSSARKKVSSKEKSSARKKIPSTKKKSIKK